MTENTHGFVVILFVSPGSDEEELFMETILPAVKARYDITGLHVRFEGYYLSVITKYIIEFQWAEEVILAHDEIEYELKARGYDPRVEYAEPKPIMRS